jgi:hypothetical protein
MNARFLGTLLCVFALSGFANANGETLYPVQGPAAAQAPPPVITAKFSGTNSGKFTLVQAHGESFQGQWAFVIPSFVSTKTPQDPAAYLPQPNLAFAWDAVYGQGYFLAQVIGTRIRRVVATGDQGTVIQVECLYGDLRAGFNGVAFDSKGNLYKVVFEGTYPAAFTLIAPIGGSRA